MDQPANPPSDASLWRRRLPPRAFAGAAVLLQAALATPMDLTVSRRRLHARLSEVGRVPVSVNAEELQRLLLTFEELTSNGLRHGRPPVAVIVRHIDPGWLIDVTDTGSAPPTSAAGGLGLYLVARACTGHGWMISGGVKHVWATVAPTAPIELPAF